MTEPKQPELLTIKEAAAYAKMGVSRLYAKLAAGEITAFKREPFTFHHLRHKHAIVWLREGGNIYLLQQRLGHSSIKQTEEYLKYVTADQQRQNTHGERKSA